MKKILSLFLCFLTIFFCAGCGREVDDYSAKEHAQRIRQRIEKNGWGNAELEKDDAFGVYPLYDENEKVGIFLVEFENSGFGFVHLRDENLLLSCGSKNSNMYVRSSLYSKKNPWSPYTVDETNNKIWSVDENGERIYYDKSPYSVTGNIDKKKYLIDVKDGGNYICAVKNGEAFINLIDGQTVDFLAEDFSKGQATLYATCIYKKPHFL